MTESLPTQVRAVDCQYKTVILLKFNVVQTQDLLNKSLLKEAKSAIKTSVKQNTFTLRLAFILELQLVSIENCFL